MSDNLKIEREISGTPQHSSRSSVPQGTSAEFLELVDSVLNVPGVAAFRWTQYTPYFNDGDACEFGFGYDHSVQLDPAVFGELDEDKFDQNEAGYGAEGLWFGEYDLHTYPNGYSNPSLQEVNGVSTKKIEEALVNFGREHNFFINVVRANFGDHAQVIATKDGFSIDEYDHD